MDQSLNDAQEVQSVAETWTCHTAAVLSSGEFPSAGWECCLCSSSSVSSTHVFVLTPVVSLLLREVGNITCN